MNKMRLTRWIVIIISVTIFCLMFSNVAMASIGYGTGDWSNGWGWWSQGQSVYEGIRNYGCVVVAQAKILALTGIASSDCSVFNPDVFYEWEAARGYIDSGFYTKNYSGPCAYASDHSKTLNYEGVITSSSFDKVWENINAGKYTMLCIKWNEDGTTHYVLVNNGASTELGRIRVFNSYDSRNAPGTTDFPSDSTLYQIYTYSYTPPPATGTLDVNGWLDGDSNAGNVAGYGTFDVYINGSLASEGSDVPDYWNSTLPAGTTYEIKDIRATSGHVYQGVANGSSLSGTISAGNTIDVRLKFLSQYTISYNANGGSGAPASQTKTYGTALTLSSTRPTRTGYVFQGWATSASATSAAYQPGSSYTSNSAATLYAVWEPQTYTVTLNANGGTVSPSSVSVTYNSTYGSLPEPTRSGYIFDSWYTASSGGSKVTSSTRVTGTSNHTLYAHWQSISKLYLPASLKRIEDEAFTGSSAMMVGIPDGCEYIGSKAFANCANLMCVFFPNNDMLIKTDAFSGCSKVMFCCYKDSSAQVYAAGKNIPYVLRSDDWVLEGNVPVGATIDSEKWTYTRTTTSTASSMAGWEQDGFTWQQTGTGTHQYASYPSGFDTSHTLYSKYAKSALSSSASGNTKREVSAASWKNFIYWHWANPTNRYINNVRGVSDGYDFSLFCAFETTADYDHEAPNGYIDPDCFATEDYGCAYSWWWWRFDVYQQTYTDYRKLFTYRKNEESTSSVSEGNGISNVKHWVKYKF